PPAICALHSFPTRRSSDLPAAGRWLIEQDLYPDAIVTSDAVRTRQTTTWVINELEDKAPTPYLDSRLYLSSASQVLSVINETERSEEHTSELQSRFDLVCR